MSQTSIVSLSPEPTSGGKEEGTGKGEAQGRGRIQERGAVHFLSTPLSGHLFISLPIIVLCSLLTPPFHRNFLSAHVTLEIFAVTWKVTMGSCVESLVFTGDTILGNCRNFRRCGLVGENRSEGVWLWSLNLASDLFLPLWLLPTISLSLKFCCRVFIVSW